MKKLLLIATLAVAGVLGLRKAQDAKLAQAWRESTDSL